MPEITVPRFSPGTLSALFGLPGAGKTTQAIAWAKAYATEGGKIVFLNLDQTEESFRRSHHPDAWKNPGTQVLHQFADWLQVGGRIPADTLVVIDYLQTLAAESGQSCDNQVASLRRIATACGAGVLLVSLCDKQGPDVELVRLVDSAWQMTGKTRIIQIKHNE